MSSVRPVVFAQWLGRLPYGEALSVQQSRVNQLVAAKKSPSPSTPKVNHLLILEHPPVYTVGLRSHVYSESEETRLRALGADFYRTNRGGLITFHGPGQLVAYPILNLADFRPGDRSVGVRRFVELIELTMIKTVAEFGVVGTTSPHTGVWVGDDEASQRKIAAIGLKVRMGVTSHGLALNCNTDLAWFDPIVPCGIEGKSVTSLSAELGRDVPIRDVIEPFCRAFADVFHCDVQRPFSFQTC
uniref:Octanoyl-[acyl-carrier-protein]:protein N-octanoyltransferase LIPT2, mitochondrial n=1 Tax=Plectus sambesii TaxID=2011161 RepID=A0A914XCM0_9BILA